MIIEDIGRQFDCSIRYLKPLRAVYIADTDKGQMIVKEVNKDPDKILYIHFFKEYLYENGFENLDRYLLSKAGLPFVITEDNRIFVMEAYIEGRECSFSNPFDREKAARTLAKLHLKGKGYRPPTGACSKNYIGRWETTYREKINDLLVIKDEVKGKKRKDLFDKKFLSDVDFFIDAAWSAYDTLKEADYFEACKKASEEMQICHHDYTYHNILINGDEINIIDFDYCCNELSVYDLATFILRILNRFSYDIDMAIEIMELYSETIPLNKKDIQLMLAVFEFPQKFWRVCERYYEGKTDWSFETFIKKYDEISSVKELKADFIQQFRQQIT